MLTKTKSIVLPSVRPFLESGRRNETLMGPKRSEIYVRRALRKLHPGEPVATCFDVARISLHHDLRGLGLFTKWLAEAEAVVATLVHVDALYVELIHNERLAAFLGRCGYTVSPLSQEPYAYDGVPSMYKLLPTIAG